MQRLRDNKSWSVFDPVDVPLLHDFVGSEFTAAYAEYESSGLAIQELEAARVWSVVADSQRETGTPFVVFQDNVNGAHFRSHFNSLSPSVYIARHSCIRAQQRKTSRRDPVL